MRRRRQEGVQAAVGVRLLAFCPRHRPVAAAVGSALLPLAPIGPGSAFPGPILAAAAAAGGGESARVQRPAFVPPPNPWGSFRAAPVNLAARRGQRAPEAVAAAEAKRRFVRSHPYLVGGPLRQRLADVPHSTCTWSPQVAAAAVPEPAPVVAEEAAVAEQGAALADVEMLAADGGGGGGAQPPSAAEQQQQQLQQAAAPAALPPPAAAAGGGDGSSSSSSSLAAVLSDGERYRLMVTTQGQRVTIGKSAIHGWGAFVKRRHAAREQAGGGGEGEGGCVCAWRRPRCVDVCPCCLRIKVCPPLLLPACLPAC